MASAVCASSSVSTIAVAPSTSKVVRNVGSVKASSVSGRALCQQRVRSQPRARSPFALWLSRMRGPCGSLAAKPPSGFISASYRLRCLSNLSASNPDHFLSAVKESTATPVQRREFIAPVLLSATFIVLGQVQISPRLAIAEENSKVAAQEVGTFVDGILSLFDSDQVTKSGKKLPKKYVKSVKEVVKSLRESFNENANDNAKFRRTADSAKEAIQEYLLNWRGSKVVASEDSYLALERALRALGQFYSLKGPQAALPEEIRAGVLEDLNKADDSL